MDKMDKMVIEYALETSFVCCNSLFRSLKKKSNLNITKIFGENLEIIKLAPNLYLLQM